VTDEPLSPGHRWAITVAVMLVTVMQIIDTSVTNVVLPHLQGSLSAGVEEVAWVVTSYLAANAIVIPATGWLSSLFGRRRFFLICTVASFLSGIAPNLEFLIVARVFQGIGGGPIIPMSQAIMWEIFPLKQRGLAMSVWGIGIMMGPIFGPTLGGWIADNWSWRWIFYINLPIGLAGFFMASAFLFDPSYLKKPGRIDALGLVLMVVGFACLQLMLDRGERQEWFDSWTIVTLGIVAVAGLVGFVLRELTADEPVLDLSVFSPTGISRSARASWRWSASVSIRAWFCWRSTRRSSSATTRGRRGSCWRRRASATWWRSSSPGASWRASISARSSPWDSC
jgi:MFS transporter, DHA2 family, multidrug resistance protein